MGDEQTKINKISVDVLTQESEFLARYRQTVQRCKDFYQGGLAVTNGNYLRQFPTEPDEFFKYRRDISYYDNIIRAPIRTLIDYIFQSGKIQRTIDGADFKTIKYTKQFNPSDIDGAGTSIDTFMGTVLECMMTDGVFLILSEPDTEDNLPRLKLIPQKYILDYTETNGVLTSVKYYGYDNSRNSVVSGNNEKIKIYYVWQLYDDGVIWEQYDDDGNLIDGLDENSMLPFSSIPVCVCYGVKIKTMEGIPIIEDMVNIARRIYNLDSQKDTFIDRSATSRLAIATDNPDEAKNVKFGASIISVYPKDAAPPSWITCDQSPYSTLLNERKDLIAAAYRLFKLRLSEGLASELGASGESKKEDFKTTEASLAGLAAILEDYENKAYFNSWLWVTGGDSAKAESGRPAASYPRSFDVLSEIEIVEQANVFNDCAIIPNSIRIEYTKRFIQSLPIWEHLDDSARALAMQEIETMYSEQEAAEAGSAAMKKIAGFIAGDGGTADAIGENVDDDDDEYEDDEEIETEINYKNKK